MTRVIKLGGRAQNAPTLGGDLTRAVAQDSRLVVVHGGGDEVTGLMRSLGREPTFIQGRRVTTSEDLDIVRMVLSGRVNKRLVSQFTKAGLAAAGISGEDVGTLRCRPFGNGEFGAVGEPAAVSTLLLEALLDAGIVPVVSPLGTFGDGEPCNVNGDDAAAAIAVALGASELLFVADVPGVMRGDTLVNALDRAGAAELIAEGGASGGMVAKLEAAWRAVEGGVARVRIGAPASICDPGAGTLLTVATAARSGADQ
ncbi:MAG: acetylglutamate kinase [Gemmatimonadota bacterium]